MGPGWWCWSSRDGLRPCCNAAHPVLSLLRSLLQVCLPVQGWLHWPERPSGRLQLLMLGTVSMAPPVASLSPAKFFCKIFPSKSVSQSVSSRSCMHAELLSASFRPSLCWQVQVNCDNLQCCLQGPALKLIMIYQLQVALLGQPQRACSPSGITPTSAKSVLFLASDPPTE